MKRMRRKMLCSGIVGLFLAGSLPAWAETHDVTVARQYGISYLPLMVMEQQHLLEKQAKAAGLGDLTVHWKTFAGGNVTNEAMLSGSLQFASAGVPPFLTLWDKSKGEIRGVAALGNVPSFLNTRNPKVKTIKDFTDKDRIALPAVKVSNQAVWLQMAAAKTWGLKHYNKLDPLTVTLSFPDATAALLSGKSEIDSHFASPPFNYTELANPAIHNVLDSYQVMGGPCTLLVVYASTKFHDGNPKTYHAFVAALQEAMAFINRDKHAAAELYVKHYSPKAKVADIEKMLNDPRIQYTATPKKIIKTAAFMHSVGTLGHQPASWKALFFSDVHALPGS